MSETPKPKPPTSVVEKAREVLEAKKAQHAPRKPHLTQRPFHTASLITLRDGMQRNVSIKNKK